MKCVERGSSSKGSEDSSRRGGVGGESGMEGCGFRVGTSGDPPTGSNVTAGTKRMSPHVPGTSASAEGEGGKGVDILTRTVDFEQGQTRRVTASLYDRTRKRWQKFGRGGQTDTRLWQTASGAFSANGHRGRAHTLRRGPNSWTTFCHLCEPPPPR